MAGLSLGLMGSAGLGGAGAIPRSAGVSPGAPTISQKAFGITSAQGSPGPRTAGFGTVALGIAGAAVLVWLWYSLPR